MPPQTGLGAALPQVCFEPVLPNFRSAANGCCRNIAKNVQQPLGFGMGFMAA